MLIQFPPATNGLRVRLVTVVPAGAVYVGGMAFHADGSLYVILRT